MEINITEKYISIESGDRDERFSVAHIRKVNKFKRTRSYRNPEHRQWESDELKKQGRSKLIAGLVFVVFFILSIESNSGFMLFFSIVAAAIAYALVKKKASEPPKFKYYDLFIGEFISGENEVYGVSSLSKEAVYDFATKVSEAMRGEIQGVYNVNIDKSITAGTAAIENLHNDDAGTINFYEGYDVSKALNSES